MSVTTITLWEYNEAIRRDDRTVAAGVAAGTIRVVEQAPGPVQYPPTLAEILARPAHNVISSHV